MQNDKSEFDNNAKIYIVTILSLFAYADDRNGYRFSAEQWRLRNAQRRT